MRAVARSRARRAAAEAARLEGAQAVAEAVVLRRFARLALEPAEPLVELVHLRATRDHRPGVDHAEARVLGQSGLAAREVRAAGCELGLGPRERLFGLVQPGDAFLDMGETLLRRLGRCGCAPGEIGFHPKQGLLTCGEVALALIQLLRVRCEPDLGVLDRVIVAARPATGAAVRARDGVGELALALLDGSDALTQLATKSPELLLGGDPDRVQALLLALDRDGLCLASAEKGHAFDDMRGPAVLLLCRWLCSALEALFGTRAADDLFALPEAETGLLDTKRLPESLEPLVELLELSLYGHVETLGKLLPELLALLRELLDLRMNLIRCHVC
jgi:hypothetical protein